MHVGSDVVTDVEEHVRQAQGGEYASFAALYETFYHQIFRYAAFKTGSLVDAEDITAEVFVRMVESISSFKWRGHPFSSWLFRIAHNLVVDHFRDKYRKKTVPLETAGTVVGTSSYELDKHVEMKLTMESVHEAIERITPLQREVISLRFAAGLSLAETAGAVNKNENAVKALQHSGLKKLRYLLNCQPDQPITVRQHESFKCQGSYRSIAPVFSGNPEEFGRVRGVQ